MQPECWLTRIFECHPNQWITAKCWTERKAEWFRSQKAYTNNSDVIFFFFAFFFFALFLCLYTHLINVWPAILKCQQQWTHAAITYDRLTRYTITHSYSHFYIQIFKHVLVKLVFIEHVLVNRQFINSIEFSMTLKWLNSFVIFQMFPLDVYRKR